MAGEQDSTVQTSSERPAPGRGGNLALFQAGSSGGKKISPISILIGLTVVGVGIVFGQALVPSPGMAQQNAVRSTPAPAVTEPAYGAGAQDPTAPPSPAPMRSGAAPSRQMMQQVAYTQPADAAYGVREQYDRVVASVPTTSLSSIMTAPSVPAVNGVVPSSTSGMKIVQVYSEDSPRNAVGQVAAGASSWTPPAPAVQVRAYGPPAQGNAEEVTSAGDTQRTAQGTAVQGSAMTSGQDRYRFQPMPNVVTTPMPVMVPAGTDVRAQLDPPVDSDLTGPVKAHVLEDVCDPRTGQLVMPRGSWLLGYFDRLSSARHLAIEWTRFTYPDLTSRPLVDVATLDEEGHTGVSGRVNNHSWQIFRDTVIGSVANAAGSIINSAVSHANGSTPVTVVLPGQNTQTQNPVQPVDIPTVEIGRAVPFMLHLGSDFGSDHPYSEPGWQGCSSVNY